MILGQNWPKTAKSSWQCPFNETNRCCCWCCCRLPSVYLVLPMFCVIEESLKRELYDHTPGTHNEFHSVEIIVTLTLPDVQSAQASCLFTTASWNNRHLSQTRMTDLDKFSCGSKWLEMHRCSGSLIGGVLWQDRRQADFSPGILTRGETIASTEYHYC